MGLQTYLSDLEYLVNIDSGSDYPAGLDVGAGPGLLFVMLPRFLQDIPFGQIFAAILPSCRATSAWKPGYLFRPKAERFYNKVIHTANLLVFSHYSAMGNF